MTKIFIKEINEIKLIKYFVGLKKIKNINYNWNLLKYFKKFVYITYYFKNFKNFKRIN